MDEVSFTRLKEINYPNAIILSYKDMEEQIPNLIKAKENRSKVEYFYTCSSAVCLHTINNFPEIDSITYLDADLYFFSDPKIVFDEIKNSSVAIIEHRFSFTTKRNIIYGKYNVGWITFRNDEEGIKCLKDWNQDCIDWCYQRLEGDKYADQKYLDKWPEKYKNVHIVQNKGANLAIWNINNYKLKLINNEVYVDNEKLVFYHFANFKQINKNTFKTDLSRVFKSLTGVLKDNVYLPYIHNILKNQEETEKIFAKKDLHAEGLKLKVINLARNIRGYFFTDTVSV